MVRKAKGPEVPLEECAVEFFRGHGIDLGRDARLPAAEVFSIARIVENPHGLDRGWYLASWIHANGHERYVGPFVGPTAEGDVGILLKLIMLSEQKWISLAEIRRSCGTDKKAMLSGNELRWVGIDPGPWETPETPAPTVYTPPAISPREAFLKWRTERNTNWWPSGVEVRAEVRASHESRPYIMVFASKPGCDRDEILSTYFVYATTGMPRGFDTEHDAHVWMRNHGLLESFQFADDIGIGEAPVSQREKFADDLPGAAGPASWDEHEDDLEANPPEEDDE